MCKWSISSLNKVHKDYTLLSIGLDSQLWTIFGLVDDRSGNRLCLKADKKVILTTFNGDPGARLF